MCVYAMSRGRGRKSVENPFFFFFLSRGATRNAVVVELGRNLAFEKSMVDNEDVVNDVKKRLMDVMEKPAPEVVRVVLRYDRDDERTGMYRVGNVSVDDTSAPMELWNWRDMVFQLSTEAMADGGTAFTYEMGFGGCYPLELLESALRRTLIVMEENRGYDRGVFGSLWKDMPEITKVFRSLFLLGKYSGEQHKTPGSTSSARFFRGEKEDEEDDYVAIDVYLPFNLKSLARNYPEAYQGLKMMEWMVELMNVKEERTVLVMEQHKGYWRLQMNFTGEDPVWSRRVGDELVPVRDDTTGKVVPFLVRGDALEFELHVVVTSSVRLPLRIGLNLPVVHIHLEAYEDIGKNTTVIQGKIAKMDLRLLGSTIMKLFPGISKIFERIMHSYRGEWRITRPVAVGANEDDQLFDGEKEPREAAFASSIRFEIPKLGARARASMKKMWSASPSDELPASTPSDNEEDDETETNTDDAPEKTADEKPDLRGDYLKAAAEDLERISNIIANRSR